MNFAKVRSVTAPNVAIIGAFAAMLLAPPATQAQTPQATAEASPRVVVMVLPDATQLADLEAIDGAALGLMSGGIGNVSASQTYLDIGQGARLNGSLYDGDAPIFQVDPRTGIRPAQWQRVLDRVVDAPTDLVPGLLAERLRTAGIPVRAYPKARNAAVIAAGTGGAVELSRCSSCPGLTVRRGSVSAAAGTAEALREGDLMIAFEAPPAEDDQLLAVAIAGLGPGTLTSPSTRIDGYVLATDLAPTILGRYDLGIPSEMSGRVLEVDSEVDTAAIESLGDRLAAVSPRRGEGVGWTLLGWSALTLLAAAAFRRRGLEVALPLLVLSVVLLPVALLLTAALEPPEWLELGIAWLGPPALALALRRGVGDWQALAIACGLTVGAHAVDVVVGSPLTSRSLLGPNPALGVRFYGIGNELEAIIVALTVIGAGAALAGFRPEARPALRAIVFGLAGLAAVAAFAPGRFGADVGAAIAVPAAVAVAAAIAIGGARRLTFLILAAPVGALALIAGIDLVLGGDAHLSRSIFEAGGLDEVGQVMERRLRLGATSFERYADSPVLWTTVLMVVAGVVWRNRVLGWFDGRPEMRAAFLGAAAGTLVGTLANDSGALLLMIGTALTSLCAGYAWASRVERV